jgi:hypothetical protein
MNNTIKTLLNHFPITLLVFVFILRCIYIGTIVNPFWYYTNLFSDDGALRVFTFIAILGNIISTYVFYKTDEVGAQIPFYCISLLFLVLPFIALSMGYK